MAVASAQQLPDPLAGGAGYGEELQVQGLRGPSGLLPPLPGLGEVHLVEGHYLGLGQAQGCTGPAPGSPHRNPSPDPRQCRPAGAPAAGCGWMWRRNSRPRPAPCGSPSIRPGISATTKVVSSQGHNAQIGHQGGEGVVGYLRLGRRDAGQQGGLAGVGKAHQPHVGQQPQLQPSHLSSPGLALLGYPGACCTEVVKWTFPRPPRPALATSPGRRARPGPPADPLRAVVGQGAHRHLYYQVRPPGAVLLLSGPFPPGSALKRCLCRKPYRVFRSSVACRYTLPPLPPSPPSGPPLGHELLPAEADGAIPAIPRLYLDPRLSMNMQTTPQNESCMPSGQETCPL